MSRKPEVKAIQKCSEEDFWERASKQQHEWQEKRMRRLITLISAGRNRTIVIRRELARNKDANSGTRLYRIKRREVLLALSPWPTTAAAAKTCQCLFSSSLLLRSWLCFDGNGPSQAQQFTGNGSHDLRFVLAARRKFLVACTQTPLCLSGMVFDFLIETFVFVQQKISDPAFVLLGPGRFTRRR